MKDETGELAGGGTRPRRWLRWGMVLTAVLLVTGGVFIASRQSFRSRAAHLRVGMTRQEVFAIIGQPDCRLGLGKKDLMLFTPLPFNLHALIMAPGQTLKGNSGIPATEFPAYVEFEGDIADRVFVDGLEVDPLKK